MTDAMQRDRIEADADDLLADFAMADNRSKSERIEILYCHYKPLAIRYAKRVNSGDIEGIANLGLFDTFRAIGRMRNANDHVFRRYLYRAIESHSINESRKRVPTPIEVHETDIEPVKSFETDLVGSIHLGNLIDELPSDQRAVMTHRFINGLTANETGLILGKKPNAVYQLQHRATKRLQRMLLTAAVLLIVIGAAVIIAREASRQSVDSSPARPTVDRTATTTTTTTSTTLELGDQRPGQTPTGARNQAAGQIEAPAVDEPRAPEEEPAPRPASTVGTTTTAPSATTATTAPDTTTTTARGNQQATTSAPTTSAPSTTGAPRTTSAPSTTLQPAEPGIQTTGSQPVVAVDDSLQLTVGQPVDFDITANDGPRSSIGTVSRISGSVDGLTLTSEGRLIGTPTGARSAIIVYRLNGNNGTSDIGQIQIIVQ